MGRRKATHTRFTPGKRLFIKLRDGGCIIDKFVETRSRHIVLEDHGKVANAVLERVTIYRGER